MDKEVMTEEGFKNRLNGIAKAIEDVNEFMDIAFEKTMEEIKKTISSDDEIKAEIEKHMGEK